MDWYELFGDMKELAFEERITETANTMEIPVGNEWEWWI